jgi:hypothetical protein
MFDDLIEKALLETNIKNQEKIYFDLQKLAIDWAIDIFQGGAVGPALRAAVGSRLVQQPCLSGRVLLLVLEDSPKTEPQQDAGR